jgi:hypothetical protein
MALTSATGLTHRVLSVILADITTGAAVLGISQQISSADLRSGALEDADSVFTLNRDVGAIE